jgi:hypothetical protein
MFMKLSCGRGKYCWETEVESIFSDGDGEHAREYSLPHYVEIYTQNLFI